jgi:hypothetical protein
MSTPSVLTKGGTDRRAAQLAQRRGGFGCASQCKVGSSSTAAHMTKVSKGETQKVLTLTVIGSNVGVNPDGVVAIVLHTAEQGPIGFAVTLESCAGLRREIAAAETHLRMNPGKH